MPAVEMNIKKLLVEAQARWLKPPEVCDLIENYQKYNFSLSVSPPNKPGSGSLFLFDRKVQRYFRKDGHNWRKKRDNRTVREAHERLKSGSVDVLHCYYAHGEEDYKFQRRCYWMLDQSLEHIVLVHYRQVTEGGKFSARPVDPPVDLIVPAGIATQHPSPSCSGDNDPDVDDTESELAVDVEPIDQPSLDEQLNRHVPASGGSGNWQFSDTRSGNSSYPNPFTAPAHVEQFLLREDPDFAPDPAAFIWWDKTGHPSGVVKKEYEEVPLETLNQEVFFEGTESKSPGPHVNPIEQQPISELEESLRGGLAQTESEFMDPRWSSWPTDNGGYGLQLSRAAGPPLFSPAAVSTVSASLAAEGNVAGKTANSYATFHHIGDKQGGGQLAAKKTDRADSFNRLIEKICEGDSILANNVYSGPEWPGTLPSYSIAQHSSDMIVDVGAVSPFLSKQKFELLDFSPEWSFSSAETKVLVTGIFTDTSEDPSKLLWGVMFGGVEVPASYLPTGVLSCVTPPAEKGRVPFYITCRDRQACSQVREFEFRDNPSPSTLSINVIVEDLRLQARLARMLGKHQHGKILDANIALTVKMQSLDIREEEWADVESALDSSTPRPEEVKDTLSELYLRQLLKDWLHSQVSEQGSGLRCLDSSGQGVLHLIAALGYSWGISPILAAGYGINFRDSRGWTALHWAAAKGREDAVAKLLASGAAPAAKTDPTHKEPAGRTAADLALANNNAGIAACLAEAALGARLSALTISEKNSGRVAGLSKSLTSADSFNSGNAYAGSDDMYRHESSVIAVKRATERASAIQLWKRQLSIRLRQQAENQFADDTGDDIQTLNEQIRVWKAAKVIQNAFRGHHRKKLQSAAVLIQRRYRGYKGRKTFLNIRSKVVRIQANVRGHLVRKQYRKILWSVGIVEKAVLRWHRKRNGFRNFSVTYPESGQDFLRPLKDQFHKDIWRDVETVRNIMDNVPAEEQYNRLRSRVEQHEAEQQSSPHNALMI